jgi:glycolate oxidase
MSELIAFLEPDHAILDRRPAIIADLAELLPEAA